MKKEIDWRTASLEERQAYEHRVWGPWAAKFKDDRRLRIVDDLQTYFGEGRHAEGEAIVRAAGDLRGKKVLEVGCGPGGQIPLFAHAGARVWAFDLVPAVVEVARRACRVSGVEDRVELSVSSVEDISYADEMFDVVVGFGVLHHVSIPLASRQVYRVLKPGGVAVFSEPLGTNPILEWARKHVPYPRKEEHGTDVPLTEEDVSTFAVPFRSREVQPFYFLSMIEQVIGWKVPGERMRDNDTAFLRRHPAVARAYRRTMLSLHRTDAALLRAFPGLGRYYRLAVMTFTK